MTESVADAGVPDSAAPSRGSGRARGVAAVILFVIGALLLPIGLVGFWGQRSVFDTARYVETVAPLSTDPTVQDAVGTVVVDQINSSLDLEPAVAAWLPPKAAPLVAPLTTAIQDLIDRAVRAILARPAFSTVWTKVNELVQRSLLTLLEGKQDGPLQLDSNGAVVLDTTAAYDAVRTQLVADQVPLADKLPETPPVNKDIVLMQNDQLARAQTIYSFTKPILTWLIVVSLVALILAIVLSRRRARMVMAVGIAFIISAVLIKIGLAVGEDQVGLALANTPLATAESAFFQTLTRFLKDAVTLTLVIGIALAIGGWVCGQSKPATSLRHWASGLAHEAGDAVEGSDGFFGWIRANRKLLAIAVAAIAVIALLAITLSTTQLIIVAIAAAVIGVVYWLGRSDDSGADSAAGIDSATGAVEPSEGTDSPTDQNVPA